MTHAIQSYGYLVGAAAVLVPALVLIVLAYLAGRSGRRRAVERARQAGREAGYAEGHCAGWAAAAASLPAHSGVSARHASTEVLSAIRDGWPVNGVYGGGR